MIKIGITGQEGFVGKHLYNTLKLYTTDFECIDFSRSMFEDNQAMDVFVKECDVIVHLAALNRHENIDILYQTNIDLTKKIIEAAERTLATPHILYSSSTQEENDNLYGKSKQESRELLANWATENKAIFTGLVIPNVFGPFGKPFYNSVVATFSHQITRGETPEIKIDGNLKLIYVAELVQEIINCIKDKKNIPLYQISHTAEAKVSKILELLISFKEKYQEKGEIPTFENTFELNLFNTFRCFMDIKNHFPVYLTKNTDNRGTFVEIIRLGIGGQVSFSTTEPNITRGNHFHTRKIERFAVIRGKALIQLRKIDTNEVFEYYLDGENPSYVDMPIWYTHNIKNIGDEILYTNFWIKEPYNTDDPDTYFVEV